MALRAVAPGSAAINSSQIVGTTTNDNAAAGTVGEYISSTVLAASAVALTSPTPADITSISLTAGDWDVWGSVAAKVGTGGLITILDAWVNTVSATAPTSSNGAYVQYRLPFTISSNAQVATGMTRISIAATTTVYLGIGATFSGGTVAGYGFIGARRVR